MRRKPWPPSSRLLDRAIGNSDGEIRERWRSEIESTRCAAMREKDAVKTAKCVDSPQIIVIFHPSLVSRLLLKLMMWTRCNNNVSLAHPRARECE